MWQCRARHQSRLQMQSEIRLILALFFRTPAADLGRVPTRAGIRWNTPLPHLDTTGVLLCIFPNACRFLTGSNHEWELFEGRKWPLELFRFPREPVMPLPARPGRPGRLGLLPAPHPPRLLVTRIWHSRARVFSCHGILTLAVTSRVPDALGMGTYRQVLRCG